MTTADIASSPAPVMDRTDAPAQRPVVERPWRDRVGQLAPILGIYLLSRLVVLAGLGLAAVVSRGSLSSVLSQWDGFWYLKAVDGYPREVPAAGSQMAFFPLYPVVVRFVDRILPGDAVVAGVAVSLLCGAIAALLVWQITLHVRDRQIADRAATLFCFFPGAFVFSIIYSEALMLACAAACIWFLLRDRWALAGLAGALASATRSNAIALVIPAAWAAGIAVRRRRELRALIAPALIPVGTLAYFAFLHHHTGHADAWFRAVENGWGGGTDYGRSTVSSLIRFFGDPLATPSKLVQGLGMIFLGVTAVLMLRERLPFVLSSFAIATMALTLSAADVYAQPRYLVVAFPLLLPLARLLKGGAFNGVVATSGACLGILTVLYGSQLHGVFP